MVEKAKSNSVNFELRDGIEMPVAGTKVSVLLPDANEFNFAVKKLYGYLSKRLHVDFDLQGKLFPTLSQLRHYGAPSPLLDVTRDPLVALWFAVENTLSEDTDNSDGIVYAIFPHKSSTEVPNDNYWDESAAKTEGEDTVVCWFPPTTNDRILAQSSGFLLGKVLEPESTSNISMFGGSQITFQPVEIGFSTSFRFLPITVNQARGPLQTRADRTPIYPIVVDKKSKGAIRTELENVYGKSFKAMFPDMMGTADAISKITLLDS